MPEHVFPQTRQVLSENKHRIEDGDTLFINLSWLRRYSNARLIVRALARLIVTAKRALLHYAGYPKVI